MHVQSQSGTISTLNTGARHDLLTCKIFYAYKMGQ